MRKSHGYRSRTRKLLKKKTREKGKIGLSKLLHEDKPGDKVVIKLNPTVHKGMPHRRYHGRVGTIKAKRGRSYVISITQGNAVKTIIARPEHLEPHRGV